MNSRKNPNWSAILQNPARTCTESGLPRLAAEIAPHLLAGERVFLDGEMGAGKSTFVRELLAAWDQPKFGGSPTFPLCITYPATDRHPTVHHLDWYRLRRAEELEASGLLETLWDPVALVLIEWGEKFPEVREEIARAFPSLRIEIKCVEDTGRSYRFAIE